MKKIMSTAPILIHDYYLVQIVIQKDIGRRNARHLAEAGERESYTNVGFIQFGSDIDGNEINDRLGSAVAINHDGSRIAVGAYGNQYDQGYVRIFQYYHDIDEGSNGIQTKNFNDDDRHNPIDIVEGTNVANTKESNSIKILLGRGQWIQLGSDLKGGTMNAQYGKAISMSLDGSRIAIGSPGEKRDTYYGASRVFQYDGQLKEWVQLGNDDDCMIGDNLDDKSGESLALSGNGKRLAIGAAFLSNTRAGYVKIYEFDEVQLKWIQLGNIIDGDGYYDYMGQDIAMNDSGSRLVVGKGLSIVSNKLFVGEVVVYEYDDSGPESIWKQLGSSLEGAAYYDAFGESVDMSGDGGRIILGVPNGDEGGLDRGFARVYEYSTGEEDWVRLGANDLPGEEGGNGAGISVSIDSQGTRAVVGTRNRGSGESTNVAHSTMFEYNSNDDRWIQVGNRITAECINDGEEGEVALSGDGQRVIIGAPENIEYRGHARVYQTVNGIDDYEVPDNCHSHKPTFAPSSRPTTTPYPTVINHTFDKDSSGGAKMSRGVIVAIAFGGIGVASLVLYFSM